MVFTGLFYSRLSAFICGLILFVVAMSTAAVAQGGGKAEPNRIEFKRGKSSITINGVVHGDEQGEYVLAARQGQRLTIKLTAVPALSSCFVLQEPGVAENANIDLVLECGSRYSKVLSTNGDYFLTVARQSEAKGPSRYKMTVTIR
jgi:hypothetical protein